MHEGEATEAELRGVDLSRSRGATRQSSTHISKSGGHPHDARISRTAEDVSVKPLPRPSRSCPWHARSAPLLAKLPYWTRASCYLRLQTTKPKKYETEDQQYGKGPRRRWRHCSVTRPSAYCAKIELLRFQDLYAETEHQGGGPKCRESSR